MQPTLFPPIMFVDWSRMKSKDGIEHAKAVRSRASKQGAKTKKLKKIYLSKPATLGRK